MTIKYIFSFVLIFTFCFNSFGQRSKIVSAKNYYDFYLKTKEADNLKNALEAIELATTHEKSRNLVNTWYYRGMIFQAIYDSKLELSGTDDPLVQAKEAFETCLQLDNKEMHKSDIKRRLKYIKGAFYNKGAVSYSNKEYQQSAANFENVLSVTQTLNKLNDENAVDSLVMLYVAYSREQLGQIDEAIKLYEDLVEMKYKEVSVYQSLSLIYINQKNYEEALRVVKEGRKFFPLDQALITNSLNVYLAQDKTDELIKSLEQAIQLDPTNGELYAVLGSTYDNLGEKEKAKEYYKKAIEIDPENHDVVFNMGVFYFNKGIELVKAMNELGPKETDKYLEMEKERNEWYNKALPFFEKAISMQPENSNTLTALQEIYARLNQLEKANEIKTKLESLEK